MPTPRATRPAKERAVTTYDLDAAEKQAAERAAASERHSLSRWIADAVRAALAAVKPPPWRRP